MWTIERIIEELDNLREADGLPAITVPVTINKRLTRTLGRVKFMRGINEPISIEFSNLLLTTGTDADIINTIKHEYVHYFLLVTTGEDHGHDYMFKIKCAEIGCQHDKTQNRLEAGAAYDNSFKYEVHCCNCHKRIGTYSRMCKTLREIDNCCCKLCGSNDLQIIQNW